jgi:hypothetical protein
MKFLIISIFLLFTNLIHCQTFQPVPTTEQLLEQIRALQVKENSFYGAGQFPAQRGKYMRAEDNSIFFSSLIAFTLNGFLLKSDEKSRKLIDSICTQIKGNYEKYRNKSGIQTYNFWKTDPPEFFPNSKLLSAFPAFQIPDDADCTTIIYLTDTSLNKHAAWLQQKLASHANLSKLKVKNTFRRYRTFKAYSTWFGKKMPLEFDICVQCNVLYFIYKNHLPLTTQDEQTLLLIQSQIKSGDYLKYAHYLSPSYKKRAVVLYHIARLMEDNTVPILEDCKKIVKKDIESELKKATDFMDKIILSTSLIRMKGQPTTLIPPDDLNTSITNYVFFKANLFSPYSRPLLQFITKSNIFDCNFYCKAYCLSLIAEYEMMNLSQPY